MVGRRLGLSQLLQPEDLGSCLGISALPRVILPPQWCKAQLSMPQFPCQEGLCPLLPTVPIPGHPHSVPQGLIPGEGREKAVGLFTACLQGLPAA